MPVSPSSSFVPRQHIKLFQAQLQSVLANVVKSALTYQQLYLVYYQTNIQFICHQDQQKLKQLFHGGISVPLRDCLNLVLLNKMEIKHNRPIFYVQLQQNYNNNNNSHNINTTCSHGSSACLQQWKQIMKQKYGSEIRWFDQIAHLSQCRKIKSYQFKNKIKHILKGTQHQPCYQRICALFPKNVKNQIQWSTFMAVVRYVPNKYMRHSNRRRFSNKNRNINDNYDEQSYMEITEKQNNDHTSYQDKEYKQKQQQQQYTKQHHFCPITQPATPLHRYRLPQRSKFRRSKPSKVSQYNINNNSSNMQLLQSSQSLRKTSIQMMANQFKRYAQQRIKLRVSSAKYNNTYNYVNNNNNSNTPAKSNMNITLESFSGNWKDNASVTTKSNIGIGINNGNRSNSNNNNWVQHRPSQFTTALNNTNNNKNSNKNNKQNRRRKYFTQPTITQFI